MGRPFRPSLPSWDSIVARARPTNPEHDLSNTFPIRRIGALVALLLTATPLAFAQSSVDSTPALEAWDANHDGVYTCDEWKRYLDRMFNLADRNHDGRLDAAEFAAVRKAAPILADGDLR